MTGPRTANSSAIFCLSERLAYRPHMTRTYLGTDVELAGITVQPPKAFKILN